MPTDGRARNTARCIWCYWTGRLPHFSYAFYIFFYIVVFVFLNVSQFLTKSRFSLSPIVFSALHWPILFYRSIICHMKFYANAFRLKFSPILLFLKATVSFPHLIDTTMRRYKTLMSIWWSDGGDDFEQNYEEFFYCTRRNALFL